MTTPPLLLTIGDAARALAVSCLTVYRLIGSGDLAHTKIGAAARIPTASPDAYVPRLAEEAR